MKRARRREATAADASFTAQEDQSVVALTADLAVTLAGLGFNVFFAADPAEAQARWLGHAVREFQIYASMDYVARERQGTTADRWLDRLERIQNASRYTGPKNGDPQAAGMAACLQLWETNRYRCPVVVDAFYENKNVLTPLPAGAGGVFGNYWRYDDPRITEFLGGDRTRAKLIRIRVCDLTGHFVSPHGAKPEDMSRAGGVAYRPGGWFGGFTQQGEDAFEILPETLTEQTWSAMTRPATRATFRVVRVVSEFECGARFDGLNAYDDAAFSFGPCHWALAPTGRVVRPLPNYAAQPGEASGYLAYWTGVEAADSTTKLQTPFSVKFKPVWPAGSAGSSKPSWKATRNYVGRIDWPQEDTTAGDPGKRQLGDLDWLRTTHWFWRLLGLSRYVPSFRRRQWDMARLRLRDILAFEIDPRDRPTQQPGTNKVRLDRMFTSETAVAVLMRCHVRSGVFLHRNNYAGPSLRLALAFADLPTNHANWGDPEEAVLIEGMLAATSFDGLGKEEKKTLAGEAAKLPDHRHRLAMRAVTGAGLFSDCRGILDWPREASFRWNYAKPPPGKFALEQAACTPLSRARNSFALEMTSLPPMPS
ncbi:hypothetical protein [Mesorhizobium sp.]|uniref:hypothetical protein n=1 Tax=Mesorhizobium sp. TaxID=1871066 RepID=UPI000FE85D54|nr:hypothetical protein [Mesorhizobium sp.]RWP46260.1 MAG: hypothetical protein EOR06_30565 [Mesorhizobium sp.]